MPAVTAAVGVSGAAVRAVERGSTGVLAPSVSPVGRVSTSLLLGRVSKVVSDEGVAAGVSVLTVGGLPG